MLTTKNESMREEARNDIIEALQGGYGGVIGVCIDVLSDNLELADLRELLEEMEYNRKLFINFLINRLGEEVKNREEDLLNRGCCPVCESGLTFSNVYEKHEVWGHNQVCKVGSVAKCKICGWEGE